MPEWGVSEIHAGTVVAFNKCMPEQVERGHIIHWIDSSMHSNFLSWHPFQFCSKFNYICPLFDIKFIPPVNSV